MNISPSTAAPDWVHVLKPDYRPPAYGFWPPAIGFWFAGMLLLLITAAALGWYLYQKNPKIQLKKTGLAHLSYLKNMHTDHQTLAQELEHLLRRYALARYGSTQVAALIGKEWLDFLVLHGAHAFADETGVEFLHYAYRGNTTASIETLSPQWFKATEQFIRGKS